MVIYQTDIEGKFVAEVTLNDTDKCPITGAYLIPAGCVETAPPTYDVKTQTCTWTNGAWVVANKPTERLCYYNNGLSYKTVDSTYTAVEGETIFPITPTTAELTAAFSGYAEAYKQQQVDALDAKYQPQFQELQLAWTAAYMQGDITIADNVKSDYTALRSEYQTNREEIG